MARDVSDTTPITLRDELIAWIASGSKPKEAFRIGTEHEKVAFYTAGNLPVPYHGKSEHSRDGIKALLDGMQEALSWVPIHDGENIIGLADETSGAAISLEPGGQFELSGGAFISIHETDAELDVHFDALKKIAAPMGIKFLSLGMSPKWRLEETPFMPKQRYEIMKRYMPKVGSRGLDMMFRTATVQANLDFSSETDMVQKLRVSLALQPLTTALFANSPFTDGALNGFLSARSHVWLDTDNNRAGMLPFAFEQGMGFERYVDYALDVPMYFVKRGETYFDVTGGNFRDLLKGQLRELPGEHATLSDWANHLSTIFPEVRLKRYLEMRGADTGPRPLLTALPALFVGLFYDQTALDGAWEVVKSWTEEGRQTMREEVPKLGLETKIHGRSLREIGIEILELARTGLKNRKILAADGQDETQFLAPLDAILQGKSEAERLIAKFKSDWGGSVEPAFSDCIF